MKECIMGPRNEVSPRIHEVPSLKLHIWTYLTPIVVPSDIHKLPIDVILGDYV